jgi:predicted DNA-binding protein with PD1-like motif
MNVVDRPGRPPLSPREGWISDGRQVAWMAAQQEQAGCVISGIGSLSVVQLRLAGQQESTTITGDLEILSLAGTLSPDGVHLHIAVAGSSGTVIGGHL